MTLARHVEKCRRWQDDLPGDRYVVAVCVLPHMAESLRVRMCKALELSSAVVGIETGRLPFWGGHWAVVIDDSLTAARLAQARAFCAGFIAGCGADA